jgi:hypothetical protein
MKGDREKIALLAAPLQKLVPGGVVSLIQSQTVFRIVYLLHEILIHTRFNVEYQILDHDVFPILASEQAFIVDETTLVVKQRVSFSVLLHCRLIFCPMGRNAKTPGINNLPNILWYFIAHSTIYSDIFIDRAVEIRVKGDSFFKWSNKPR